MNLIAKRDSKGNVSAGNVSAKIPKTRGMLGIVGLNGLINNGEYREDGFVYLNDKPVRKWHVNVDEIRLWEPKLKDLSSLYELYKKTQDLNNITWGKIHKIMVALWGNHKEGYEVKVHAKPTHKFTPTKSTDPWWEYRISKSSPFGLGYSFDWLDEKPKKLQNAKLGSELYYLDMVRYKNTASRYYKAKSIFYHAMKCSLPKASEHKIMMIQFKNDSFVFYTVSNNGYWYWSMFDDQYKFETKRIL